LDEDARLRADAAAARDKLIDAARAAGELALQYFRVGERTTARIDYKPGGSPVTEADIAVDAFLRENLSADFPGSGWLSEESEDDGARLSRESVLIVDPIDGTRGFLAGDPRWTVSAALVVAGRPFAGVLHAPALGETYAAAQGCGSTLNGAPIEVSRREALAGARIAGPKPLVEAIERAAGGALDAQPRIPSLALRMALVASGALDLGVASGRSHDWDIAAADLILAEAGGRLVEAAGAPLRYNSPATHRGALFAASGRLIRALLAAGRAATSGEQAESPAFVSPDDSTFRNGNS
jgi:myo-inositol-1(or 4)-monophosphatase